MFNNLEYDYVYILGNKVYEYLKENVKPHQFKYWSSLKRYLMTNLLENREIWEIDKEVSKETLISRVEWGFNDFESERILEAGGFIYLCRKLKIEEVDKAEALKRGYDYCDKLFQLWYLETAIDTFGNAFAYEEEMFDVDDSKGNKQCLQMK